MINGNHQPAEIAQGHYHDEHYYNFDNRIDSTITLLLGTSSQEGAAWETAARGLGEQVHGRDHPMQGTRIDRPQKRGCPLSEYAQRLSVLRTPAVTSQRRKPSKER
ncbi:hypothetical protein [Pseudomonas faucium]|uniref:hypothetical protein n=1 Tax=Pseudomonas faucium TaxID=2740518 RepID=UPI001F21190F|nr:hypothetical protein [Pseudomonas faucium]